MINPETVVSTPAFEVINLADAQTKVRELIVAALKELQSQVDNAEVVPENRLWLHVRPIFDGKTVDSSLLLLSTLDEKKPDGTTFIYAMPKQEVIKNHLFGVGIDSCEITIQVGDPSSEMRDLTSVILKPHHTKEVLPDRQAQPSEIVQEIAHCVGDMMSEVPMLDRLIYRSFSLTIYPNSTDNPIIVDMSFRSISFAGLRDSLLGHKKLLEGLKQDAYILTKVREAIDNYTKTGPLKLIVILQPNFSDDEKNRWLLSKEITVSDFEHSNKA